MSTITQKKIEKLQAKINDTHKAIVELRRNMKPEPVGDYSFTDWNGKPVKLSKLFGKSDELMVIHNMGKACVYCTLWADGFNGLVKPLNDRMPMIVVNKDTIATQKAFAKSRGWKFKMLSVRDTTFNRDLKMEDDKGFQWPGVSALIKKEGKIYRASYDYFGPGDYYNSSWHLFDLFPNGDNDWQPKYKY